MKPTIVNIYKVKYLPVSVYRYAFFHVTKQSKSDGVGTKYDQHKRMCENKNVFKENIFVLANTELSLILSNLEK